MVGNPFQFFEILIICPRAAAEEKKLLKLIKTLKGLFHLIFLSFPSVLPSPHLEQNVLFEALLGKLLLPEVIYLVFSLFINCTNACTHKPSLSLYV